MFTIYELTIPRILRTKLEIHFEKQKDIPYMNNVTKDTIHIPVVFLFLLVYFEFSFENFR
jgi:hypothetical protein